MRRVKSSRSKGSAGPETEVERTVERTVEPTTILADAKLEIVIRDHVTKVLQDCNYNCTLAAQILGITERTLYNYRKKWGMR